MAGLTSEQILGLLTPKAKVKPKAVKPKYPPPPQNGPLKWFDKEMRCSSKGCGSPTYLKVEYKPLCSVHALRKLNELVIEVTELRKKDLMV